VRIVADLLSAGRTEKSMGGTGLVVRQDLWDQGVIRDAEDLVGRSIYLTVPASGQYIQTSRWLLRHNIDPRTIEWSQMGYPEILAAMQNGAIELGLQTEPLLSAGVVRGVHHLMVSQEEMDPNTEPVYVLFWTGIDRLGPQVGERFLVAMLRAVRDYVNAFEYGIDLDGVIAILTRETFIRDPAVYRQIKYGWVDPDGVTSPASLQADADLFHELGMTSTPIDLSAAFDDRYRRFAVQYLGEYRPPR
jgi:NitT/TauT family transport system substrate-binding protein